MQLSYLLPTEAVALQSINSEHIAEELITEETFDDNMTNFTLQLLAELYWMQHVCQS